jgi:hypothetical protein
MARSKQAVNRRRRPRIIRLRYVNEYKDRHGKVRRYFRRPGEPNVPLPGIPGSAEFLAAYAAALAKAPKPKSKTPSEAKARRNEIRAELGLEPLP